MPKKTESAELKVSTGKTITSYKYSSLKDFNKSVDPIIAAAARTNIEILPKIAL